MSRNFEEGASRSVPNGSDIRNAASGIDDASAEVVIFGRAVITTAQNSVRRGGDGRGVMGPADLEWEFLTRWGLLKSPWRWNIEPDRKCRR